MIIYDELYIQRIYYIYVYTVLCKFLIICDHLFE
jgi:hypothetical protein